MTELINSKIFKELSQNDRSFLYRSKSSDGMDNLVFVHQYTAEEVSNSLSEFNRTYGMVNDGSRIRVEPTTRFSAYYKLKTDILLPKEFRKAEIQQLVDLLSQEARAIFVYINGKKIPDNILSIYATNYGTDIFVPYSYVPSWKGFKVFIEKINLRDKEYVHYYSESQEMETTVLTLKAETDDYFDFDTFNNDKFLVYVDGKLTNDTIRSSINKNDKTITISYSNGVGKELEIFYNHFIVYRKQEDGYKTDKNLFFKIDKDYESSIHGVIPKRTLGFYRGGIRIPINEITQESRQIYSFKQDVVESWNSSCFFIQDAEEDNNEMYLSFNSDYYLNGMLGNDRLLQAIKGEETGTVFDKYIGQGVDYAKILTNNGERYDDLLADRYIDKLLDTPPDENYQTLTKELIRRNPSLVRNFLKLFAGTTTSYWINKVKGDETPIRIGAKLTCPEGKVLNIKVYLNRDYIDYNKYTKTDENGTVVLELPASLFEEGINFLEINETLNETASNQINYLSYEVGDLLEPDSKDFAATLPIARELIDQYTDDVEKHLVIFQMIEGLDGYLYPTDKKIGYVAVDDFVIDQTESEYRINFKTKPVKNFIVYFRNFSYNGSFRYEKDGEGATDSIIYMYSGSDTNPIPIAPVGIPEVYVNNQYYIYGIDYVYSTPMDNAAIGGTLISFLRVLEKNDLVSLTFNGIENKGIINVSNMEYESKYGLLYFSTLEFPFHTDYLDLYIDGKKIFQSDIDIFSDKLIRVRHLEVPFKDLYLQTKFTCDYEDLTFFFDAYKEDEFELLLEKLFIAVDPVYLQYDTKTTHPDQIYEEWEDTVGENTNKDPNPESQEPVVERQNLLTAMYMKWIISDDARSMMLNGHKLGDKVFGYFKLYQFDTSQANQIHIDLNKREILGSQNIGLNCNIKPLGYARRMNMILEALKQSTDVDLNNIWSLFINDKISNQILPIDFPFEMDLKTGWLAHLEEDVNYFPENQKIPVVKKKEEKTEGKVILNTIPDNISFGQNEDSCLAIQTNGEIQYEFIPESSEDFNPNIEFNENTKEFSFSGRQVGKGTLVINSISEGKETAKRVIPVELKEKAYMVVERPVQSTENGMVKLPVSQLQHFTGTAKFSEKINTIVSDIYYKPVNNNDCPTQLDNTIVVDWNQYKGILFKPLNGYECIVGWQENNTYTFQGMFQFHNSFFTVSKEDKTAMQSVIKGAYAYQEGDLVFAFYVKNKNNANVLHTRVIRNNRVLPESKGYCTVGGKRVPMIGLSAMWRGDDGTIADIGGNTIAKDLILIKNESKYLDENISDYTELVKEYNNALELLDTVHMKHYESETVSYDSNVEEFKFSTNVDDIVTVVDNREENKLEITGNKVGKAEILITSTDQEGDYGFKSIIPVTILPLPDTILEVSEINEIIITQEAQFNIVRTNGEIEFTYDETKLELIREGNVVKITGLELGEASITITAQAEKCYPTTITINLNILPVPQVPFEIDVEHIYCLEESIITINVDSICDSYDYELITDVDELLTIVKQDKVLTVTANKVGYGKLKFTATKHLYEDIELTIPIRITERAPTIIDIEPHYIEMAYPGYDLPLKVITDARNPVVASNRVDLLTIEKVDEYNFICHCLIPGEVQISITGRATELKETTFILNLEVTDTPEETPLSVETPADVIEWDDLIIPFVTEAESVSVEFDKENYEEYFTYDIEYFEKQLGEPELDENENPIIPPSGQITLHTLKPLVCNMILKAKVYSYLEKSVSVPINIVERAYTELSADREELDIHLDWTDEIRVTTNAEEFTFEVQDPEFVEITQDDDDLNLFHLKGKVIGTTTLVLRAVAEGFKESLYFVTINAIEKPQTTLTIETSAIVIGEEELNYKPVSSNAKTITAVIDNKSVAEVSITKPGVAASPENPDSLQLSTKGLVPGEAVITVSAAASKHLPASVDIPVTVMAKTQFSLDNTNLNIKIGEKAEVKIVTDIEDWSTVTFNESYSQYNSIDYNNTEDKISTYTIDKENKKIEVTGLKVGYSYITLSAQEEGKVQTNVMLMVNVSRIQEKTELVGDKQILELKLDSDSNDDTLTFESNAESVNLSILTVTVPPTTEEGGSGEITDPSAPETGENHDTDAHIDSSLDPIAPETDGEGDTDLGVDSGGDNTNTDVDSSTDTSASPVVEIQPISQKEFKIIPLKEGTCQLYASAYATQTDTIEYLVTTLTIDVNVLPPDPVILPSEGGNIVPINPGTLPSEGGNSVDLGPGLDVMPEPEPDPDVDTENPDQTEETPEPGVDESTPEGEQQTE